MRQIAISQWDTHTSINHGVRFGLAFPVNGPFDNPPEVWVKRCSATETVLRSVTLTIFTKRYDCASGTS